MRGYSLDLRLKVLAAVDFGMPRKEVARTFGVSKPTVDRYLSLRRQTGEIGPPQPSGRAPSLTATITQRRALWTQLEENDDATLERHCELWESKHGDRVSVPTMWRAVRKLGWSKKRGRWEPPKERKITEVLGESA
jgi:transposase